jgi:ribonuclease J
MTRDFVSAAREANPEVLLTEGTRVSLSDPKSNMSEGRVLAEASKAVDGNGKLALSTFRGNDTDRINTFDQVAKKVGRRLVVSMKTAMLLEMLAADKGLVVPRIGKDVDVYVKRKRSGTIDDADYRKWERQFLDKGVSAKGIREKQQKYFLHLETWSFPELIDIKPDRGGTYIHAATEAYNEEGEQEEEVIRNWIDHMGFSYHQVHASGHAPIGEVERLVGEIGAKEVVPVHTEHPELFSRFKSRRSWRLKLPEKGKPISVGRH